MAPGAFKKLIVLSHFYSSNKGLTVQPLLHHTSTRRCDMSIRRSAPSSLANYLKRTEQNVIDSTATA